VKSERSAATDDAPSTEGPTSGPDEAGTEGGPQVQAASGNGNRNGSRSRRRVTKAGPATRTAGPAAAPPEPSELEPAGDAPGPVVDGRPVEPPAGVLIDPPAPGPATTAPKRSGRAKRPAPRAPATERRNDGPPAPPEGASTADPVPVDPVPAGDDVPAAAPPIDDGPRPAGTDEAEAATPVPVAEPDLVVAPIGATTAADIEVVPPPPTDLDRVEQPSTSPLAAVTAATSAAWARVPRRRRMIRSRKVRRVVRHIDPWSVLTFSVIFHLCLFGALLLAGSLVWSAASAAGVIANVESFVRDLGDYETWEIQGSAVLRAGFIIAGMLTVASTVMVVLLTVVFNLISDLIGGIRITVIEEEVHHVPAGQRK
jgi:hypothetical protein